MNVWHTGGILGAVYRSESRCHQVSHNLSFSTSQPERQAYSSWANVWFEPRGPSRPDASRI